MSGIAGVRTDALSVVAAVSGQQLIIYRAGSLTRAFKPLETAFTCQTGIQVKDVAMGSVDAGRQITAGGQAADLYAPADYLDIDLFMKPAGYANFDIVFAHGRMVLAYSVSGLAAKKCHPSPNSCAPKRCEWYEILTMPGVTIGGGNSVSRSRRIPGADDLPVGGGVLQSSESLQQPAGAPGEFGRGRSANNSIFSSPTNTTLAQRRRQIRITATWICPTRSTCPTPRRMPITSNTR